MKNDEIKIDLNSQILSVINAALPAIVIPALQGIIGALGNGLNTKLDLQSAGLHKNTKVTSISKYTLNQPKRDKIDGNRKHYARESSMDSINSERECDTQ